MGWDQSTSEWKQVPCRELTCCSHGSGFGFRCCCFSTKSLLLLLSLPTREEDEVHVQWRAGEPLPFGGGLLRVGRIVGGRTSSEGRRHGWERAVVSNEERRGGGWWAGRKEQCWRRGDRNEESGEAYKDIDRSGGRGRVLFCCEESTRLHCTRSSIDSELSAHSRRERERRS